MEASGFEAFDVVVLGNPNNPTGSMQSRKELRHLFEMEWSRAKHWIVDEAFHGVRWRTTMEETLLSIVEQFPSLIVLRSLTKSWRIPGLRAGFLATAGPMERLRTDAAALEHQFGGPSVGETFPG